MSNGVNSSGLAVVPSVSEDDGAVVEVRQVIVPPPVSYSGPVRRKSNGVVSPVSSQRKSAGVSASSPPTPPQVEALVSSPLSSGGPDLEMAPLAPRSFFGAGKSVRSFLPMQAGESGGGVVSVTRSNPLVNSPSSADNDQGVMSASAHSLGATVVEALALSSSPRRDSLTRKPLSSNPASGSKPQAGSRKLSSCMTLMIIGGVLSLVAISLGVGLGIGLHPASNSSVPAAGNSTSGSASGSISLTASASISATQSSTWSQAVTASQLFTSSQSPSNSFLPASFSQTKSFGASDTPTPSETHTQTVTQSQTSSQSVTASQVFTSSQLSSGSRTQSQSQTVTQVGSLSQISTPSQSATESASPKASPVLGYQVDCTLAVVVAGLRNLLTGCLWQGSLSGQNTSAHLSVTAGHAHFQQSGLPTLDLPATPDDAIFAAQVANTELFIERIDAAVVVQGNNPSYGVGGAYVNITSISPLTSSLAFAGQAVVDVVDELPRLDPA